MIGLIALMLSGCADPSAGTGGDTGAAVTGSPGPDDTGGDSAALDRDSDGVTADEDCDDLDPSRYPGADEVWDGVDNDCDGYADADGAYTGAVSLSAAVTYEGVPYRWSFDCPLDMTRLEGRVDFNVTCLPTDPEQQERVDLLLGAVLTIQPYPGDEAVSDQSWGGWVVFTSSEGWDSEGEGALVWSDLGAAEMTVGLESVWLDISGSGSVQRQ